MAEHGCAIDGSLIQGSFAKPLPVIGIYITGATLLCMFFMSLDALHAIRRQKPWFPCNYFSLNAASLTLLTIATKLPVDLNTGMPSRSDQLSKLSGSVLICTVMGNLMPSLGAMNDSEILPNIIALGIFVITVSVNVFIQMGTGVIYVFLPEHTIIIFFMLLLLMLFAFSALTVPTTKEILNEQYDLKFKGSFERRNSSPCRVSCENLKREVEEFWMMAHTSSPQYVLGRSAICAAAGAFCLLSALIFAQAMVRSYVLEGMFCSGKSDYGWSTWLVFVSQALTVVVGSIAPVLRWLNAINFRSGNWSLREEFRVEKYWFQRLEECKRCSFPFHISNRHVRVFGYGLKIKILNVVIATQRVVIWGSKFIRLISIVLVTLLNYLLISFYYMGEDQSMSSSNNVNNHHHPLEDFVLHLEGEQDLVGLISQSGRKDTEKWIERGRKNRPKDLISLLEKSTASEGYKGVLEFDRDEVPLISEAGSMKPPNCWALPVVTLASIAVSLPRADRVRIKKLLRGVSEGLKFVKFIEKHLDGQGFINMREAAEQVWLRVDLHNYWFDVDLRKLNSNGDNSETPVNIIRELAGIGKGKVLESRETMNGGPIEWPSKSLAAYAMYRQCETILLDREKYQTTEILLDWLEQTISDLLCACLLNLPRALFMECCCAGIEEREARVRNAAYNLGEAENFLRDVRCPELVDNDCDKLASVDNWRSGKVVKNSQSPVAAGYCSSFSSEDYMSRSDSDELSIYIVGS